MTRSFYGADNLCGKKGDKKVRGLHRKRKGAAESACLIKPPQAMGLGEV